MTTILVFLGLGLVIYAIATSVAGFIPKRGRCIDAEGEEIFATIINKNNTAEKPATIRAIDENGRKYAAKLRPTEAKMWIKGDKIKIVLSEDKKKYRILFHEYFKENEERMREQAFSQLENKIKPYSIAAKMANYTKESLEALRASEADSQTIFIFTTYMRVVNRYFIVAILAAVLCAIWCFKAKLQMFQLLLPLVIVIVMFLSVSSTVRVCTGIYNKVTKKS